MAVCSCKTMTSLVLRAISRGHTRIIIILFLLSSISLATGCDGTLHDFEDADLTEWRDCGGSSWYIDPSIGHESKFSLRSGPIDCTGISRICREVKGPAEVTFWWQCEPLRQGIAELTFTADDTRRVCDSSEWSPISYTVRDNNTHQLIWEFRKIKCYPKNAGAGWIDDVCISSETPTIPSEIKMGNVSDGNMSCDARVISSGVVVELSNFTIVANEVTMETTNVTINPSGDVLINPNEINISSDKVSMNTPEVIMSPAEVVMGNFTMNTSEDVLIRPNNVGVFTEKIIVVETLQDNVPQIDIISPEDMAKCDINKDIIFEFMPLDDNKLCNCTFYIVGDEENIPYEISNPTTKLTKQISNLPKPGYYTWYVTCCDNAYQCNSSGNRTIIIKPNVTYVTENSNPLKYEYNNINSAIENVSEGGTVYIEKRNSDENVFINNPLRLIAMEINGTKPVIEGVVTINSSDVIIEGLEIRAKTYGITTLLKDEKHDCGPKGPNIPYYDNITISSNIIVGGSLDSISLVHCKNITIYKNFVIASMLGIRPKIGVRLSDCLIGNVSANNITSSKANICLGMCSNILLSNNIVRGEEAGTLAYNFESEINVKNNTCLNNHGKECECIVKCKNYGSSFCDRDFPGKEWWIC